MPRHDGVEPGPRSTWTYIFVRCSLCERWISEEDRHACSLSVADRHERAAQRAAKVNALHRERSE